MAAAVVLESTVNQLGLHARCIEAGVHEPGSWRVVVNDQVMPVYVESSDDGNGHLGVTFVAGPMPEGTHYVSLELHQSGRWHPMFGAEVRFVRGEWWKHSLKAQVVR